MDVDKDGELEKKARSYFLPKAKEAKTKEDLISLIDEVNEWDHGYGSVIVGIWAVMLAAFNVMNRGPNGGITGFQASCLGWESIREFFSTGNHPVRLVDYGDMLFPQYKEKFQKTITPETWDWLQLEATKRLESNETSPVSHHWASIKRGEIPFGYEVREQ